MNVILGFAGRLGRLHYFLVSLALAAFLTVVIFSLVLWMAPSAYPRGSHGEPSTKQLTTVLLVTLPIYGWFTLALMTKRIRDIGWDPFVIIVGWIALTIIDCVAAHYVPARLVAHDGSQTLFGMLLNLVLFGCLLFWPGTGDDVAVRPASAPRMSRLEALSAHGAGGAMSGSFGRR